MTAQTLHPADLLRRIDQLTSAVMIMANNSGQRLTRAEFAARLGIHTRTLAERVKNGSVPGPKNGKWLLSDIVAWEARQ